MDPSNVTKCDVIFEDHMRTTRAKIDEVSCAIKIFHDRHPDSTRDERREIEEEEGEKFAPTKTTRVLAQGPTDCRCRAQMKLQQALRGLESEWRGKAPPAF